MDWWQNEVDHSNKGCYTSNESNIWPIEHPNEPQDEDQPIKCPNPHPSLLNEGRILDYPRRSVTSSSMLNKEKTASTSEPRARPMRKRHQRSSVRKEDTSTPSYAPPRHSFSAHDNHKIFPMFQKFYKNES